MLPWMYTYFTQIYPTITKHRTKFELNQENREQKHSPFLLYIYPINNILEINIIQSDFRSFCKIWTSSIYISTLLSFIIVLYKIYYDKS